MRDASEHSANPRSGPDPPDAPAVRTQLERILASNQFAAAEGARKLLRFVVEQSLEGRADRLKEYTLATEVFGRDASFDPKINPTVRVEAGRLRRRLEHYYLTVGRADPVLIELPRGGYAPKFSASSDVLHLGEALARAQQRRREAGEVVPCTCPDGPSIAVMPFENLGSENDAPFADGISIEILTALTRFREFCVLGRGTVFGHRGERDAKKLNHELGVDYMLSGSLRRDGQKVRVHAELRSGTDALVLWAERYERDLSAAAMFAIEDEISAKVVATIAQPYGIIARPEAEMARRKPPERLRSYDCLMLFYDYTSRVNVERHKELLELLDAEVREAPTEASLWAVLSMLHNDTWRFGFNATPSREAARERALAAALQAVELDPQDALGYHALFLAYFAHDELKAFRDAGARALELNPNQTDILADFGLHLTMCDEWERGLLMLKLALSLNPEPPDWYWFPFFLWHFENHEYDEALEMALRARNQEFFWTHGMHALAFSALGMRAEAAAAVSRLIHTYPEFPLHAREELERWLGPSRVERTLDALHEAGLPVAHAAS